MNGFDLSESLSITKGSSEVAALYLGDQLVWPTTKYAEEYLTITSREDGNSVYFYCNTSTIARSIQVSKNKTTWTTVTSSDTGSESYNYAPQNAGTLVANLNKGEKLYVKGTNSTYCVINYSGYSCWTGTINRLMCTKTYNLSGNIMSLMYGDNFANQTSFPDSSSNFGPLFGMNDFAGNLLYNTTLVNARNLVLPVTTMNDGCYVAMFSQCTALTSIPKLPATTLANSCYKDMFYNCTSITMTPRLDAVTLQPYCYYRMFYNCSSLERMQSFGALYTATSCCYQMFSDCTNLVTVPTLKPRILARYCYYFMFSSCHNLEYVDIRTTDSNPTNGTGDYLSTVAPSGILKKPSTTVLPIDDPSGVPLGWTIFDLTGYYAVNITSPSHGTLTTDCSGGLEGDIITIIATPDTGYSLDNISVVSGGQTITITNNQFAMPDDDVTVTATFVAPQHNIVIDPSMTNGTVTSNVPTAAYGDQVTLTVIPDPGYGLTTLYVNSQAVTVTDNQYTFTMGTSDVSVTANFDVVFYKLYIGTDGNGEVFDVIRNSTSSATKQGIYYVNLRYGDQIDIQIYPHTGYDYGLLTAETTGGTPVSVTVVHSGAVYRRFTMPASDVNVSAEFDAISSYSGRYLTLESSTGGSLTYVDSSATPIYYSVDGAPWESYTPTSTATTIAAFGAGSLNCVSRICIKRTQQSSSTTVRSFGGAITRVFGNSLSFLYGDNYDQAVHLNYGYEFYGLFINCTNLTDASNLVLSSEASDHCYHNMFYNCTSLTGAPTLPATYIYQSSYYQMFWGCSSLTTAPALPATTLASGCYYAMFRGCSSLLTVPELPATTLATGCYYQMFYGCGSITTNSVATTPVLPAPKLKTNCYYQMFNGCTNLNRINILATDNSATGCTTNWLYGVASTGVLTKPYPLTLATNSASGIPTGWTVNNIQYYTVDVTSQVIGGTVTPSQQYAPEGATITLTLTPGTGYEMPSSYDVYDTTHLSYVTVTDDSFVMPASSVEVQCTFDAIQYTVDIEPASHGSVSTSASGGYATYGQTITVTTTPDAGYQLSSLTLYNFTTGTTTQINNNQFTMPAANVVVEATFSQANYNVNIASGITGGTVTSNKNTAHYGEVVTLTVTPDSDYNLDTLTVVGASSGSSVTVDSNNRFVMPAEDVTVNATFIEYYSSQYFTIESLEDNNDIQLYRRSTSAPTITIQWSTNGTTWNNFTSSTSTTPITTLNTGDKMMIRGNNTQYASADNGNASQLLISTKTINVFGNIMSLLYGDNFVGQITLPANYTFRALFYQGKIVNASNLVLPATTLTQGCYKSMFDTNRSLIATPKVLPAMTLANNCYLNMFCNCSALTSVDNNMLPATTLAEHCYEGFLGYCTQLINSPVLPASNLANYCYQSMFQGCTKLKSITCLATNTSVTSPFNSWVLQVGSGGTFTKKSGVSYSTGSSGIPTGWTVVEV